MWSFWNHIQSLSFGKWLEIRSCDRRCIDLSSFFANSFPSSYHTIPVLARLLFCRFSSHHLPHPTVPRRLLILIAHRARLLLCDNCLICPVAAFRGNIVAWNSLVWCERCLLIIESPRTPGHYRYLIWVLVYIPYTGLVVFNLRFLLFLCILRFWVFKSSCSQRFKVEVAGNQLISVYLGGSKAKCYG